MGGVIHALIRVILKTFCAGKGAGKEMDQRHHGQEKRFTAAEEVEENHRMLSS